MYRIKRYQESPERATITRRTKMKKKRTTINTHKK